MDFGLISYSFMIYSFLCIFLGIFLTWFTMKKTNSSKSFEIKSLQESLSELLKKHESLKNEKFEIEKQYAVLKNEAQRIPEIEESLKNQNQKDSSLEVLNATLEERLEAKESESREKLKFLEEAKKLMGTEFENLSAKIFEKKSKQFTEENKSNIQNLLNPIQTKMKEFQEKVEKFHLEDETGRASIKAELEHFKEISTNLSLDAQNLLK